MPNDITKAKKASMRLALKTQAESLHPRYLSHRNAQNPNVIQYILPAMILSSIDMQASLCYSAMQEKVFHACFSSEDFAVFARLWALCASCGSGVSSCQRLFSLRGLLASTRTPISEAGTSARTFGHVGLC
jgi:hypothetical protein